MLKINKILSKKIKSPLSLRGAKRRSNLSGFSLIELMVAAAILAFILFGIFQAYSTGFMGMADARDRTVATNYAREAMEDVKNMDFELITNENLSTPEIIDGIFNRVVTISDEHANLKKITTQVFWTNRKGQIINIDTTMHINVIEFNPGAASKIILYANPYYTILPSLGIVDLIAVIKDEKGNTKIDWDDGDIYFTVLGTGYSDFPKEPDGSYLGYLGGIPGTDEIAITPTNGVAKTTFTASNYIDGGNVAQGDVIIKAWVVSPDITSTPITITVTLDVVRIDLSADPTSIEADGTSTSTVTAALKNSGDTTVEDAVNDITFNISGEGTFVNLVGEALPNTVTLTPPDEPGGIATIYVKSINDTPGTAIVTASSEGLLSDTVNIITFGDPHSISVSVNPNLIYTDDLIGTKVTVTIKDINGNPVEYTGTINLSTSDGTGAFVPDTACAPLSPPDSLCFDDASSKYTYFSSTSQGTVTITASGDGLISGNTDIEVKSALIADNIALTADPQNILVGGGDYSEITATVKQGTTTISKYNNDITFQIISDSSFLEDALLSFKFDTYATNIPLPISGDEYGNDGVAEVQLFSASNVGTVTIQVSTTNSLGTYIEKTVNVGFYSNAHHINLNAVPPKMAVNGETCSLNATIVDENDMSVSNYNEEITFTILEGWPSNVKFTLSNTSILIQTVNDGVSSVELTPQKKAGTVKMRVASFTGTTTIEGYLNIPVGIILELVNTVGYDFNSETNVGTVSFDIDVQGAALLLEEMQVLWLPYSSEENVTHIKINTNDVYPPGDNEIIKYSSYTYESKNYRSAEVDISDKILPTGISNIEISFNSDMPEKELIIIFNPNSGYYPVGFTIPIPLP